MLGIGLVYLATLITRSWGPPDEGLLGQSAERVLRGQLPHRDFIDLYTGGLTAVHALAFRLLGTRLVVLRWLLFVATACWLPTYYAVARRFAAPVVAAAVTVLALVWSVATYPASMPTWYTLFLATGGLLALCEYAETDDIRWLVLAGVCGGLSMSVKIVGIYFVGAAALFVVYRARALTTAMALLYVAALVLLIRPTTPGMVLAHIIPGVAVAAALLVSEWRPGWPSRHAHAWRPLAMLSVGVAIGVLPVVLVYAAHHDLRDLLVGVFVLPTKRLPFTGRVWHARAALGVIPLLFVFALARQRGRPWQALVAALILVVGLGLVVVRARTDGPGGVAASEHNVPGAAFRIVVDSLLMLLPFVAVAGAWLLARSDRTPTVQRDETFATLAVAATVGLTSYPFANDLYFFYYAPLVFLATLAVVNLWGKPLAPSIVAATLAVYIVFGVVHLDARASAVLPLVRSGGLHVPPEDSAGAVAFVNTMQAHARGGYTYATPDCPEAYFLTGLRNPTPTMYEFFEDTAGGTERILHLLDAHHVTAVAISSWRIASHDPNPRLLAALRERYPDSTVVWHFTVRWLRSATGAN